MFGLLKSVGVLLSWQVCQLQGVCICIQINSWMTSECPFETLGGHICAEVQRVATKNRRKNETKRR